MFWCNHLGPHSNTLHEMFSTICPKTITLQHVIFVGQLSLGAVTQRFITEIVLEVFSGAVILTGDLSDFCTVISGNVGLSENEFLVPQCNFYISEIQNELFP